MKKDPFKIHTLGSAERLSPLPLSSDKGDQLFNFVTDSQKIVFKTGMEAYTQALNAGYAAALC